MLTLLRLKFKRRHWDLYSTVCEKAGVVTRPFSLDYGFTFPTPIQSLMPPWGRPCCSRISLSTTETVVARTVRDSGPTSDGSAAFLAGLAFGVSKWPTCDGCEFWLATLTGLVFT